MPVIKLPEDYVEQIDVRREKLTEKYNAAYAVTDTAQRAAVEKLLARIGTIDWKSEGYQSPDHQRDLSIKFHWGHNHRFADDLEVVGRMQVRHLSLMAEFSHAFDLPTDYFQGKDVLDIGCWTGGTTLSLKMQGANRVVAFEEVRKYAEATNVLANDIYGLSDVECLPESLYALDKLDIGLFDRVYFPGVIYHLSDPVLALRHLFNRLHDGGEILVESAGIDDPRPMCWFRGNQNHFLGVKDGDLNRGGWAWFWPSAPCLEQWMYEAGFEDVKVFLSPIGKRIFGYGKRVKFRDITRAGLSVVDVE